MGKRVGSPADRLFVYEQVEANNGQAGDSLCDRLRLDLKLKISNRSLRQWHRDTKKAIAKAKRNSVMEAIGSPSQLPRSTESDTESTPDSPPIDVSGLSRVELLDRAIDERLTRLVQQVSSSTDQSLAKIVSDLMEARRRELSIPTQVMEALGALGRLAGLIERLRSDGDLPEDATLRSVVDDLVDRSENPAKQLEAGDSQSTQRNPEFSSLTIAELVEELLAVPLLHNEWIRLSSYIHVRVMDDTKGGPLDGWFEAPRSVRAAMPELLELYRRVRTSHSMDEEPNLRPVLRGLIDSLPPAVTSFISKPTAPEDDALDEGELMIDEPEPEPIPAAPPAVSEAEQLANAELARQRSARIADARQEREKAQQKHEKVEDAVAHLKAELSDPDRQQLEMKHEIARMKLTGEWNTQGRGARVMLCNQAGFVPTEADLADVKLSRH